jgi:hypothetical protein
MGRSTEFFNFEESRTFTFTVTVLFMIYKLMFIFSVLCTLYRPQNTITQKLIIQIFYSYKSYLQ